MNLPQIYWNILAANKHEKARKNFNKNFVFVRVCSRLNLFRISAILICVISLCAGTAIAQTGKSKTKVPAKKKPSVSKKQAASKLPKVVRIDAHGLKNLLKPGDGKPLLINFWATWCVPCREEFPDLVKIGADYKDRIDLITVSLDDLAEINRDVPKFLAEMKSDSPAFLLKTPDESAAIAAVSKDWQGGLPFTILFDAQGTAIYIKQGKFDADFLRAQIEKALASQTQSQIVQLPTSVCRPVTLKESKSN